MAKMVMTENEISKIVVESPLKAHRQPAEFGVWSMDCSILKATAEERPQRKGAKTQGRNATEA
jgi:hypothetical protein